MKNNIIEKNKKETNELLIKNLGLTLEEFQLLSNEEKQLIFMKYKEDLQSAKNNFEEQKEIEYDDILQKYKDETNQLLIKNLDITLEKFQMLSIEDLIRLFRNQNNDISHNDSKVKIKRSK